MYGDDDGVYVHKEGIAVYEVWRYSSGGSSSISLLRNGSDYIRDFITWNTYNCEVVEDSIKIKPVKDLERFPYMEELEVNPLGVPSGAKVLSWIKREFFLKEKTRKEEARINKITFDGF